MLTDEEVSENGVENGTHKIINLKSRHSAGLSFGEYILFTLKAI